VTDALDASSPCTMVRHLIKPLPHTYFHEFRSLFPFPRSNSSSPPQVVSILESPHVLIYLFPPAVRTKIDADLQTPSKVNNYLCPKLLRVKNGPCQCAAVKYLRRLHPGPLDQTSRRRLIKSGTSSSPFEYLSIPAKVAGCSTAIYVDYRCMWRIEAGMCLLLFLVISFFRPLFLVLTHTPILGVGSRQIRHFELSLIQYDLHHISIYILTFHAHLMIIVSKLARILRGRNGDQHLDI